jgi:hypothetical protein
VLLGVMLANFPYLPAHLFMAAALFAPMHWQIIKRAEVNDEEGLKNYTSEWNLICARCGAMTTEM